MDVTEQPRWLSAEENETWLALWSLMTWLPARLDAQLRADAALSLAEYNALSQISQAPDREIRLSELAQISNMTLSHLSRVISRMMNAGWVTRRPDPQDGRYTLGRLTAAGWEKVQEAAPAHVEEVRRVAFDQLSPEQVRVLGEAASRIADAARPRD